MIGRVYYSVREGDYVVDLDDNNGWAFATAAEAERFAEVFRAAVRYHAEVEREECARLCEYAAATDRAIASGWRDESTPSSDRLLAVARLIRARGTQEPPQRPEAPRDGATPAPDAPSPAGCLPVAATKGGAAASEADALREALRFLCRADVGPCEFCGATATKRSPDGRWWSDVCAPPDAVDHEHAATLRPLLPTRGGER
jgi:hypothetical protein